MAHITNYLRLVSVTNVDYTNQELQTVWLDTGEDGPLLPIPHPFGGLGEGIFVGIRPGTVIVVDRASFERYIPLAILPLRAYSNSNFDTIDDLSIDSQAYPNVTNGDIYIQNAAGGGVQLEHNGNMNFFNAFNEGLFISGDGSSDDRCMLNIFPPTAYSVTEGGIIVNGLVKRDTAFEISEEFELVVDPLYDPKYEQFLEEVGRDPSKSTVRISPDQQTKIKEINDKILRNPGFVENRQMILEFGRQWSVDGRDKELARLREGNVSTRDPMYRSERRNNVLGLSLSNPNELIEEVQGTLVDIFGNIIDINKELINDVSESDVEKYYDKLMANIRKTVVYHKEINTRKGYAFRPDNSYPYELKEAPKLKSAENNARDRSKWSIDVDKEGLTKINIPASSETGNIPVIARAENSSELDFDSEGNPKKTSDTTDPLYVDRRGKDNSGKGLRDIYLDQVGPGGITVTGQDYKNRLKGEKTSWVDDDQKILPSKIEAGTAFHNITKTAKKILDNDANRYANSVIMEDPPSVTADGPAVYNEINNKPTSTSYIPDESGRLTGFPNAGGRSAQINMDGSLELSIGANTIDRVSWMLDTAGGIVARLGRDRYGRSANIQSDGSVYLEVGGYDYVGESSNDVVDTRFCGAGNYRGALLPKDTRQFRAGKVVIKIRSSEFGTRDNTVIIDETGITLDAGGRLNLNSKGDLIIKSNSSITMDAPRVKFFKDDMARDVVRSQKPIF